MSDNSTKANLIAKILFIAGGIILFIVLVIFIFRLVPIAVSNLTNIGSNISSSITNKLSKNEIGVTTTLDEVEIQTPVTFSLEHNPGDVAGQYFVSYNCVDNLFYDIQSKNGPKRLICESPLKLGSTITAFSLVPIFTKENAFTDSIITIEYKDEKGTVISSGSKTITIKGSENVATEENLFEANGDLSGSTVTTQPIPATTAQTAKPTTSPSYTYIKPTKDLVVTHLAPTTHDSSFVMYVYNYGNTSTGPWEFSYTDAENPSRTILSPIQASLSQGQGLAVTVRFDGQDNTRQTIAVVVDPLNKISETNESNNFGSTVITGDSSNSNDDDSYDSNDDADLTITTMQTGRMSGNRFVEDDEIDEDDTAAVRFIAKNQGGESTGSWRFEIDNLPYRNDDTYRSKSYSSLRPGQSLEVIVEFDQIDEGRYTLNVELDSDDDVDEEKENNNTESETLEVQN